MADADVMVMKVNGIYTDNPKKWAEYGVDARDSISVEKKLLPDKGKNKSIHNESDADGFIIQ